jgi:crossover junction endodeoxyribonuclease RusA
VTTLNLPYAVSANRYWRNVRGRMIRSDEANAYRQSVLTAARQAGMKPIAGRDVTVQIVLQPRMTQRGLSSKSRLDLDNCIKVVLDALNAVAYTDDRQVVRLMAEIGAPIPEGGLTVTIMEAEHHAR